jgi:hypothetical protein
METERLTKKIIKIVNLCSTQHGFLHKNVCLVNIYEISSISCQRYRRKGINGMYLDIGFQSV